MPELPEVETIRLYLDANIKDDVIKDISILEHKQFVGDPNMAIGKKVINVARTGKILHLEISNSKARLFLNFHLKLSGQILFAKDKKDTTFKNVIPLAGSNRMPGKTTRIIIHFEDGSALFFNDLRKFGWVKLSEKEEKPKGIDVLSEEFTENYFKSMLTSTKRAIKVVLMDQDRMAGIGNIYANDALYNAKIHPARPASALDSNEQKRLYKAILDTISESIKYKGSSAQDELYVLPDSSKGDYQHHFKVYHQHGTPCKHCGTTIVRITLGGRGTFFCPNCQEHITHNGSHQSAKGQLPF